MPKKVKIHYRTFEKRAADVEVVSFNDAKNIVQDAQAQGHIVFNRRNGMVVDVFDHDLEEIVIVDVVEDG